VNLLPRQKLYVVLASTLILLHLVVAALAKPSFPLSLLGEAVPCVLLLIAVLAVRENFRGAPGILPLFWKLFAGGFVILLLSQAYWFYFDWRRLTSNASPVIGDSSFLLAHILFLSSLALRPHSSATGRNLRIRGLDFVLLTLWWFSLYGNFCLPWQVVIQDFSRYNPSFFWLLLIQHLANIVTLVVLSARNSQPWRNFYLRLLLAFVFIAAGNLFLSWAIEQGKYYPGGYYDTIFLLGLCMFTFVAVFGSSVRPREDRKPNREILQSVWTARLAMLGILSLPVIAFFGLYEKNVPLAVATFRLRLVFGAMLILGGGVYWKLHLLARELAHLVRLTGESIENLTAVQQQVAHSEKLAALGRLAAGAAHEISNPLTAIFGYSELLTDLPSLSPEDRADAQLIQQQVHRSQAAIDSLRSSLRRSSSPTLSHIDKNSGS
jgi:hypothetical protein